MNKQLAAAALIGAVGLAGLSTAGMAAADSTSSNTTNPMDSLVSALAEKFNLNQAEVQQVFEDHRGAMQQQRDEAVQERVQQLVSDGELSQDQANALLDKRAEHREMMEQTRNQGERPSSDERQEHRAELKQWAEENGIDAKHLRFVMGGKGPGGPGNGAPMQHRAGADDISS